MLHDRRAAAALVLVLSVSVFCVHSLRLHSNLSASNGPPPRRGPRGGGGKELEGKGGQRESRPRDGGFEPWIFGLEPGAPLPPDPRLGVQCSAGLLYDTKLPHALLCDRSPPCIFSKILGSKAGVRMCKEWKQDSDWPTFDPVAERVPGMKTVVDLAHLYPNSTWWFVGDSINSQMLDAAACGLHRAGYGAPEGHRVKKRKRRRAAAPAAPAAPAEEGGSSRDALDRLLIRRGILKAAKKTKDIESMGRLTTLPASPTLWVEKGWGKYGAGDFAKILEHADVVVVNYGLHYSTGVLKKYREDMDSLFGQLAEWQKQPGKVAVFRETSAQHFVGTGSFSSTPHQEGGLCQCAPMEGELKWDNDVVTLNRAAREAAAKQQGADISFLPFYNLTVDRHQMHHAKACNYDEWQFAKKRAAANMTDEDIYRESGPFNCCDCTHFCYTPVFWDKVFSALWHVVADGMERGGISRGHLPPPAARV